MTAYRFDDCNIRWRKLEGLDHLLYAILDIDRDDNIADVIFKFEAHQPIVLHRHKAMNKMLVIHGEHRIYQANGELKEIRPVGRYTASPAHPEPHRECGGDDGAIVFFSIRANAADDVLYELLDEQENLIGTITLQTLIGLHEAHG